MKDCERSEVQMMELACYAHDVVVKKFWLMSYTVLLHGPCITLCLALKLSFLFGPTPFSYPVIPLKWHKHG